MPEVAEVRGRGFMAGIDLGEHDSALRLGHRVVLEARRRGAIVRPLGDVVVLMPPLSISKADLSRLVGIVAEAITAAMAEAYSPTPAADGLVRGAARPTRTETGLRRAA
jgi:adenosylmethionine-8-amino-7-oxononanoate aminotransferase